MGWTREDDRQAYDDATLLQYHLRGGWVVLWGPGSRKFWAIRVGAAYSLILSDVTPRGLYAQAQTIDLRPEQ